MRVNKTAYDRKQVMDLLETGHASVSFSQAAEDLILHKLFKGKRGGFYVDIGAHHPVKFSNTHILHALLDWRGVNIDADPAAISAFQKARPADINIHAALSDEEGPASMTMYSNGAVNTLDDGMRKRRERRKSVIVGECVVETRTLASVLDEYLPVDQSIDFFDVDVEGYDLRVLRSNDWNRYRPEYVLAEMHDCSMDELGKSELYRYMKSVGYRMISLLYVTGVFKRC